MAETLVSIAKEKLSNVAQEQLELFAGAPDELESLKRTFQSIQAFLADAESRQVGDDSVRPWLSRLRAVSYDIGDVLDEWEIISSADDQQDESSSSRSWIASKVCECFLYLYDRLDYAVSRQKVAWSIKEIRKKLDQIADDQKKYGFSSTSFAGVQNQRVTTPFLDKSEMMIGRENDKETVISRLVSEGSSHEDGDGQVHVVAIVGIGGLGKTTLAQQIYHDSSVRDHFEKALYWVCVSETFDVMRVTKEILEEVKGPNTSPLGPNLLQKELLESLSGKRFLLVLDDVWNNDPEEWKKVAKSLTSGARGSRILVTTRSVNVASAMNACSHKLGGLSDEQSWELFSRRAFAGRKAEEILENVGKKIVNRCRGVPLSIKVIGSAMQSKRTVEDWNNVLDSQIWDLPKVTEKILPALLLTYSNLPTHLKQCFVYCSMFPKDWKWEKSALVRLWLAVGFIRPEGNRELEDIGAEYFDDLVAWSMFQQVQENSEGEITCKMHDLLHDLAQFIAKHEIYTFTESSDVGKLKHCPSSSHIRHAFVDFRSDTNFPIAYNKLKKLQTVWLQPSHGISYKVAVDHLCHQARFLRALVVSKKLLWGALIGIEKLPDAIGKMKHLRYIDLSHSDVVELPESMSHLCNLHTLNLSWCKKLKKLPRGMSNMVSLRHLEIEGTHDLEYLPKGLGRISCLRSLSKFIVGGGGRGGEGCRIDELRQLNSLRGSLRIEHLERVSSLEEAETAEVWNKVHLRKLVLHTGYGTEVKVCNVLEGLRPHVNLEELELEGGSSSNLKLPSWMKDLSLSKLTKLRIRGFKQYGEPENLPRLGKLPALQSLQLSDVGVRKVGREFYYGSNGHDAISATTTTSFPRLEELSFDVMEEWVEWESIETSKNGDDEAAKVIMPCLRKLELSRCRKLEELPHHLANSPLTYLSIEHCGRIKGTGFHSFPHLETFMWKDSREFLSSSDLPDLPKLTTLKIGFWLDGGWERLAALQELQIRGCSGLMSLPDDGWMHLQSLKRLTLFLFSDLVSLPEGMGQLESLEILEIWSCQKLCSLPDSLGQLKKLKKLHLQSLAALTCVPDSLGMLESLESLAIAQCSTLCSLPDSLGQLKALERLWIFDCPLLSMRYKVGREDWPKISHIPHIRIID